ncbi:MAG: hypothetical protein H6R00_2438 [Proteobacteria bacterium]|nr:hypothetical protein [Pseudomonadota bacterium]
MLLSFSDLLQKAGLVPGNVRLLRHQTKTPTGRTPYLLWRDHKVEFAGYQSVQTADNRAKLAAPLWASFVAPPTGGTLFVGLYEAERIGTVDPSWTDPLYGMPVADLTQSKLDRYETTLTLHLDEYIGRLWIEWGSGARSWIQRPDHQDKAIVELTRAFHEDSFPGYARFRSKVSEIEGLPRTWISALQAARGVYLLVSAKTREQYVGSATGADGFFGRWQTYAEDGHGGNIGLKSSEPSDYEISILEVSGSAASQKEILDAEKIWKQKLKSREMGLNRN